MLPFRFMVTYPPYKVLQTGHLKSVKESLKQHSCTCQMSWALRQVIECSGHAHSPRGRLTSLFREDALVRRPFFIQRQPPMWFGDNRWRNPIPRRVTGTKTCEYFRSYTCLNKYLEIKKRVANLVRLASFKIKQVSINCRWNKIPESY